MTAAPLPQTLDQAHAEILRLRAQVEAQARTIRSDGARLEAVWRVMAAAQKKEAAE